MAKWSDLKAAVAKVIKTNSNQEITGAVLQNVLNNIISNVGENATFAGVATPTTCLLYTSPSPRDYAASRMPSSA